MTELSLADNPETPTLVLDGLSESEDYLVRWMVAAHENTSTEALDKLSREVDDEFVTSRVAINPNTSIETLKRLVDVSETTRMLVLELQKSQETLRQLTNEYIEKKDKAKLSQLASNKNLPTVSMHSIYEVLEDDMRTLINLAKNPSTPAEILFSIYKKNNTILNEYIVKNPNYDLDQYIEEFIEETEVGN